MLNIKTWIMARGRPAVEELTKPCVFLELCEGADGLFEFYLEVFHNISTFKENIKYSEITGNMQLFYFNEVVQEKGRTQGPV